MNFLLSRNYYETNAEVNNIFRKRNICVKIMSQYQSEDIFLRLEIRICVFSIKELLGQNCPSYLENITQIEKNILKVA